MIKKRLADIQWDRYMSAMDRGHEEYQRDARKNEDFYLGAGRQWDRDIKSTLEAMGRPWQEENIIFPTINTVLGYQTQSRMDIAYKPREEDDQGISDVLSKLAMFIVDQNRFPWKESQVFADGLIQQRGYFDIRIDFTENMNGDVRIETLDPLDVIPDPDAKTYNPDDWSDVIITKWVSLEDIKILYGATKYKEVSRCISAAEGEPDFGGDGIGIERNKFANEGTYYTFYSEASGEYMVRTLERQWYKLTNREFFFDITTGDLYPVPDSLDEKEKKRLAKATGRELIKKIVKRIRWTVSTKDIILHDAWSPYEHFTVVPFFPFFRRGKTIGMVDNLIKTQEMVNKVYSQILHVINTTANSGWVVEENSLSNMEVEELEDNGSQTGLVIEYKAGRQRPEKIQPNSVPAGLKDMLNSGIDLIRLISGVSETFQGGKGPEVSGTAIQSRVHQSAIQLATPIDALFRTRYLLGERLLKLIQQFYTSERTIVITQSDPDTGEEHNEAIPLNKIDESGEMINDITVGKYDIVIADVPTQITFQNAQFQQALDMRKFGVHIPDDEMIRLSTLSRKADIAKKMQGESPEVVELRQKLQSMESELEGTKLLLSKAQVVANERKVEAAKKAAEVATLILDNPAIGPMIDQILKENTEEEVQYEQDDQPNDQQNQNENPSLGNFF
jgi:hypothetical protein